ncbi:hypothetical protein PGT21_029345 [Puccinia graminis f. sp. tritici]|uniref:Uncharacterized protein n=1 Tax=Puccinia graminis f. sp. tritici TaxID=56615 RepID=A0A5B0Q785_PUCGR|nr:hypothetical protein PGT21_029345 [Puccinia graminis f. sp. tritici]
MKRIGEIDNPPSQRRRIVDNEIPEQVIGEKSRDWDFLQPNNHHHHLPLSMSPVFSPFKPHIPSSSSSKF